MTEVDQTTKTPVEQLTEEELLAKVIEYKVLAQRATADYRNLQRETERRLNDMRQYAGESVITELCPLVDYFNTAFAAVPEADKNSSWLQGMRHIQTYLMTILQNHQVQIIEAVGKPFNPSEHESVGEEDSDQPAHTVTKVMQAGFTLNGKVIRPAKVMVAKEKSTKEKTEQAENNDSVENKIENKSESEINPLG
ncbi:MAG: nucleotide exchange factor GrpE [Patescibacteria group bacterium]|jgi:molecular chaperone GrpE